MAQEINKTCSTGIQTNNVDDGDESSFSLSSFHSPPFSSPRLATVNKNEKRQRILLVVFASLSTFFYAGGFYGWGPMQLMLEENGNFASLCNDMDDVGTTTSDNNTAICPNQTAAFLNCKFVSQLTLLSGTVWGILSDKYGTKVLIYGFGICNIVGLALLIIGILFPASVIDGPSLYGAFVLIGLGSTVGGMMTVETGLLFRSNPKQQNRIISLLNALFDAGAMAYLGLWGLEHLSSSFSSSSFDVSASANKSHASLLLIIGGYLCLAVLCIFGYAYFFQTIQTISNSRNSEGAACVNKNEGDDEEANRNDSKLRTTTNKTLDELLSSDSDLAPPTMPSPLSSDSILDQPSSSPPYDKPREEAINVANEKDSENSKTTTERKIASPSNRHSYIPIAQRLAEDQLKSKAYVLLATWFSFYTISNHWTLTTARDFLGGLGDDAYGNRYLTIFTLMTPVSIVALPFLDVAINRYGFHAALQTVNALAIAHGLIKVGTQNLNTQVLGFVFFTFFRCFLYAVSLSCVAVFMGKSVIGRATGTLYVLAGLASVANIGLAHLASEVGNFFVPDLVFLVGTIPMVYITYEIGKALEKDRLGLDKNEKERVECQMTFEISEDSGSSTLQSPASSK